MEKIAPMLIPVRAESCKTYETITNFTSGKKVHTYNQQYFYTCKNYDVTKHKCLSYENRPDMCKNYPYSSSCHYRDCTFKYIHIPTKETVRRGFWSIVLRLKLRFKKKNGFKNEAKLKGVI